MTPENFCYWLQGRVELQPDKTITQQEWQIIQDHLKLVFDKQTPFYAMPNTTPNKQDTPSLFC